VGPLDIDICMCVHARTCVSSLVESGRARKAPLKMGQEEEVGPLVIDICVCARARVFRDWLNRSARAKRRSRWARRRWAR